MVCGSGKKTRAKIQQVDTNCAIKDVLQGKYIREVFQGEYQQDIVKAKTDPTPNVITGLSADDELEHLISIVAVRLSRWMYKVQYDAAKKAMPPAAESFELRSGRIFSVSFSVLNFTEADSNVQEQRGMVLVTITGPNLPPFKALFVAFRGTARLQDWMGNISPLVNDEPFSRYGIGVHAAWHGMVAPRKKQEQIWKAAQDAAKWGAERMILTGHSMGGALAQIAMMQVYSKLDEMKISPSSLCPDQERMLKGVECVTFASPMPFVTDEEDDVTIEVLRSQRRALQWMSNNAVNFVNNNDVVSRLPGCLDFLREVLATVRPASVAYKLGTAFLNGAPVLRRYRPITRTSMIGHVDVAEGHLRLNLQPWDPECARALCIRQVVDDWHDKCPIRGKLTAGMLQNWISGGSIYCFKDHLPPRYEGYVLLAFDAKEAFHRSIKTVFSIAPDGFRKLPVREVKGTNPRHMPMAFAKGDWKSFEVEASRIKKRASTAAVPGSAGGVVLEIGKDRKITVAPGAVLLSDSIFVGDLPRGTDAKAVRAHFEPYGEIVDVIVTDDKGFVQFETYEAAEAVLENQDGHKLGGKVLDVQRAAQKQPPPEVLLRRGYSLPGI